MATEADESSRYKTNIDRTLALSDGIFAVAITLLVLDIKIPDQASDHLLTALLQLGPNILSYFISFLVIGLYWHAHRSTFHIVRRYDNWLGWLNLFFLLSVSFLPVPTAILGHYGNSLVATIFYALCLTFTGILSFLLWWYISTNHRLIDENFDSRLIISYSIQTLIPPAIFLLSIGIAFINIFAPAVPGPNLAQYFWLLIIVLRIIYGRWYKSTNGAQSIPIS